MDLVHFNPFREMDSLFSRFRQDFNTGFNLQNFTQSDWVPPVDINETDKEFVFYLTRHTCASRLVQRNVPLHIVKEWLGHRNFEMTLRYAKLTPTNMLDAKNALEQSHIH